MIGSEGNMIFSPKANLNW